MRLRYLLFSTLFLLQAAGFSQTPGEIMQAVYDNTNIDSLTKYVEELSGEVPVIINGTQQTIQSRNKYQPGNALAEQYIKEKLESYSISTTIQSFSSSGKNVIGTQTGSVFPNKYYIICAHYDDMPSGPTAPGADDNASGTAGVIEAARIFSQYSFPYTIVYALWDEEEQGLIGSDYYAGNAAAAGDTILGVFNMDMIAYDSDSDYEADIHVRDYGNTYQLRDKMIEINSQFSLGLVLDIRDPGSTYSDHASFWNEGYGAVLLIEDNSDFHPYYHTTNDLIQYFNYPFFEKCAKLMLLSCASFALNLEMVIDHTPIASTDQSAPITTTALISSGLEIASGTNAPRLYYRTKTGGAFSNYNAVTGTPTENTDTYQFIIPAQGLGTTVQYYIAAQDTSGSMLTTLPAGGSGFNPPGSTPPPDVFQFFVAPEGYIVEDDASTMTNWTATGSWNITTASYVSAPSSFTDSPGGNYSSNSDYSLTLDFPVNLLTSLGAELEFSTKWDIENNWDYGQVEISTDNGSSWTPLEGNYTNAGTGSFQPNGEPLYDGQQTTWVNESIDISQYVGGNIIVRFRLVSDSMIEEDGWYIDDVKIKTYYFLVPVELASFTTASVNNGVELKWSTATETNNRGFAVERSTDNVEWKQIDFIEGSGTTTEPKSYRYIDTEPAANGSYYRLMQYDYDGTATVIANSELITATPLTYGLEQNYPNPFNPSTTISYTLPEKSFINITIYDITGKEVAVPVNEIQEAGAYKVNFNAAQLSSGMYIYAMKAGEFYQHRKMLLLK